MLGHLKGSTSQSGQMLKIIRIFYFRLKTTREQDQKHQRKVLGLLLIGTYHLDQPFHYQINSLLVLPILSVFDIRCEKGSVSEKVSNK